MLCVEFPQVKYIDFSEIVNVTEAVAILTGEQRNLSTLSVVTFRVLRCPLKGG